MTKNMTTKEIKKLADSKSWKKMTPEELQLYMHFRKRHFSVPPKKGKGAKYDRKKVENYED